MSYIFFQFSPLLIFIIFPQEESEISLEIFSPVPSDPPTPGPSLDTPIPDPALSTTPLSSVNKKGKGRSKRNSLHPKLQVWKNWIICRHLYIYLACLFVCIQLISKRLNRSGPNFVWDLTWPQGRFMNDQNFKNLCLKVFIFEKFWKCAKKYYEIRKLFCFCFILYKEKMFRDKATIKSWNRRWARSALKA